MEVANSGIRPIIESSTPTAFARAAVEMRGPLRSFALYSANRLSGGRLRSDLNKYFAPQEKKVQLHVELGDAHGILSGINNRIIGSDGVPENFIGEDYERWTALKAKVQASLPSQTTLTDYVLFDVANDRAYLVANKNQQIVPIRIDNQPLTQEGLRDQITNNPTVKIATDQGANGLPDAVGIELAISQLFEGSPINKGSSIIRRMSSITNDFICERNTVFDREGEMFSDLRQMGVWSLGEMQELCHDLFSRGVYYDPQSKEIKIDQELGKQLLRLRRISLQQETQEGTDKAKDEIRKYARESVYFNMVLQYFKENPQTVNAFLQSDTYQNFSMRFKDRYLSSIGLTESAVAANMLANYYLLVFEQITPEKPASQASLAKIPDFYKQLREFITGNEITLPLFEGKSAEDQMTAISELYSRLKVNSQFTKEILSSEKRDQLAIKARNCFTEIRSQIKHNRLNKAVLNVVGKKLPVASKGVFSTTVANLGLARIPGESQFTAASWFPSAGDYMPQGKPLPEFTPVEVIPTIKQVEQAIKYIFNGQMVDGLTPYGSQEKRIFETAPLILSYLQHSNSLPENVKKFMQTLSSPDLAIRILERFGPIADNDPMIINRFFPDGFAQFQQSAIYRYVFEFARGVETNLILKQQGESKRKMLRRFGGRWQNNNFSSVDEFDMQFAIGRTVKDASHRIDMLNHEEGVSRRSLKDWQEFFEKSFGWDTFDMKFLRWEKFWNVWDSLGPTWDCICFGRKSIFNPRVLQQW